MLLFAATAALIAVTPVHAIQGTAHASPYTGSIVTTRGVATRTTSNGFFLQDVRGDGNDATADGLFVYTGSVPAVIPGDEIEVTGTVVEFLPGNDTENLTVTELHPDAIRTLARGRPLPPAVAVGGDGRVPPLRVIDDDHLTDFDPGRDGIDFWESLEGMRVRLLSPRVVGPTGARGDVWVVAQDAFDTMSARGALTAMAGDEGPERIRIHDALMASPMPAFNAGDVLADVEGVVSYRFGGFEVLPHTPPTLASRGPAPETVSLPAGADRLTITTFNVYNLAATDSVRMHGIAGIVVRNLRAPAILVLQEIQDSNGAVDDGTVDAACTLGSLAAAIRHAGGPAYSAREVPPEDGADGGRPGANIRVAVMFDPARVSFVDRGFPSAGTASVPVMTDSGLTISASPGRMQPAHPAWQAARKPLVLEFVAGGTRLFVIGCHFSSRSGTSPEFGAVQPPIDPRAAKRFAQAEIVRDFVQSLLRLDADARIIVAGDFNDDVFSGALAPLSSTTALFDLMWRVPEVERYSYVYEGAAHAYDRILVSPSLVSGAAVDVVHAAAHLADAVSDHDPVAASFLLRREPGGIAGGVRILSVRPNPSRAEVFIAVEGTRGATVTIHDVRGGVVRTAEPVGPGMEEWVWDGKDDTGRPVASGVYLVRVAGPEGAAVRRIVRLNAQN